MIAVGLAATAQAVTLNIPGGDLGAALDAYTAQTGVSVIVSYDVVKGIQTQGVHGDISADDALVHILTGTGFVPRRQNGAVMIVPKKSSSSDVAPMQLAQAAPAPRAAVETVTVTSSKLGGADVQSIPISITALSQEQLTATQTAGGPDLVKQVPNLTFSKTNFTRLQHPNPWHRHAGHFSDDRSGRGRGIERYPVHPQSLFRAGILRC